MEIVERVDEVGGLYFRSIFLPKAGIRVPQHDHTYDHVTLCCSGSAYVYVDGKLVKMIEAGEAFLVEANKKHEFESIRSNTRLCCITDLKLAEGDKLIPLQRKEI